MPEASQTLMAFMGGDISFYTEKAQREVEWCHEHGIRIITIDDEDYPSRLRHCYDAPLVLFVRGNCRLNVDHVLNIVGTRKCTQYGTDFIKKFIKDISERCPDVLIVSGLAYGVDICAHRSAMENGICTAGVVAHGHDQLYPQLHRNDAKRMIENNGAIITEYVSGMRPEARNFLQRNRIIAGMSDATIVIESASHGGGLVTARLAIDYGRDVFAVPGPVNAEYSKGCNNLIRDCKAELITCADDVMNAMGWEAQENIIKARRQGIERTLFPTLTPTEQTIVDALKEHGDSQSNAIAIHTGMPIGTIASTMFSLEMKGIITQLPGNTFHLIE